MTDSEKLDLILSEIQNMKSDIQGINGDIQGMEKDIQALKQKVERLEIGQLEIKNKQYRIIEC